MKFNKLKYYLLVLFIFCGSLAAQESPAMLYQLGQRFEQTGNFERAKEFYQKAYDMQPFNLSYLTSLNNVFIVLKEYDNSIQLLNTRLTENPDDLNSISLLGTTYYTQGDTIQAYEVWEKGLSTNNNAMARYRVIINTAIDNRAFNKAVEYLKRAKKQDFSSPVFSLDLAYIYSITMNYEKAAVEYLNVLKQY